MASFHSFLLFSFQSALSLFPPLPVALFIRFTKVTKGFKASTLRTTRVPAPDASWCICSLLVLAYRKTCIAGTRRHRGLALAWIWLNTLLGPRSLVPTASHTVRTGIPSPGGSLSGLFQALVVLPLCSGSLPFICFWVTWVIFCYYFSFASSPVLFVQQVICLSCLLFVSQLPFHFVNENLVLFRLVIFVYLM